MRKFFSLFVIIIIIITIKILFLLAALGVPLLQSKPGPMAQACLMAPDPAHSLLESIFLAANVHSDWGVEGERGLHKNTLLPSVIFSNKS